MRKISNDVKRIVYRYLYSAKLRTSSEYNDVISELLNYSNKTGLRDVCNSFNIRSRLPDVMMRKCKGPCNTYLVFNVDGIYNKKNGMCVDCDTATKKEEYKRKLELLKERRLYKIRWKNIKTWLLASSIGIAFQILIDYMTNEIMDKSYTLKMCKFSIFLGCANGIWTYFIPPYTLTTHRF